MKMVLVNYEQDFYYGKLCGLFTCRKSDLDKLNGATVYFGEVLGKHSEVYSSEVLEHCSVLGLTEQSISMLHLTTGVGTICGVNPVEIFLESEEDDHYEDECGNEDCTWCNIEEEENK